LSSINKLVSTNENLPSNPVDSTIEYDLLISEVQETIENLLDQCCNILSETFIINKDPVITTDSKYQRKIRRLEQRLSRLSRIIRELEEKEMTLDEMAHCDLYEVESNLKKQACQVYYSEAQLVSPP
jgi:vacuolar-type H+-ATPase subunit I/STV1